MPNADQDSNRIIEELLDARIDAIQGATGCDVLTYIGPIAFAVEEQIKFAVEDIDPRKDCLFVILETSGGYMETAERIANVFRHHYQRVEFIVPNFAMSAGTILVMSGDAIHMDYSSVLGPIDPQVPRPGSDMLVPALGYLEQYERLVEKDRNGELTTVEATYLVQNFNAAELYRYEQERELSKALLTDWLVKYKFKNWTTTQTSGTTVTDAMRVQRAEEIAMELNRTDRWHSHSRGITMEVLRRDLNLLIDDFGTDATLGPAVREYYRLLKDYVFRRGHYSIVLHTRGAYQGI